jgi:hypothetical protein
MPTENFEKLLDGYSGAEKCLNRFVEIWRKGLVGRLLLVWVTMVVALNPGTAKWVGSMMSMPLPQWYSNVFFTFLGLGFFGLVWLAITCSKAPKRPSPESPRRAIKGLCAFGEKDADLFKKLQREQKIRQCCESLIDQDFRLGVLAGVSGAGKTSLLKAGLRPRLAQEGVRCITAKLTQQDPIESTKSAVSAELDEGCKIDRQLPLADFLEACFASRSQPVVLALDQFEEFFIDCKQPQDRQRFINALKEWYERRERISVRILLCIREEFFRPLNSIFQQLDVPLTRRNSFDLEKFAGPEAEEVLAVLAEMECIEAEPKCISYIVDALKSKEDGLVRPADLQMVAESIWRVKGSNRAFTMNAVRKLGGVEGLRQEYLEHVLAPLRSSAKREAALHVLSALIDGRRRAAVLNLAQIQEKLISVLPADEVKEAVVYLAHPDNQLILVAEENKGFELTHDTLIPSIQKLVKSDLPDRERARRLLKRRTSEWLGNDRSPRYLLTWADWRAIRRYPELSHQIEEPVAAASLIQQSSRRFTRYSSAGLAFILLLTGAAFWWTSASGSIYRLKADMAREVATTTIKSSQIHAQAALAHYALTQRVMPLESDSKRVSYVHALVNSISGANRTNSPTPLNVRAGAPALRSPVLKWIEHGREIALQMDKPALQTQALSDLARAAAQSGESALAKGLLDQGYQIGNQIDDPVGQALALSELAKAAAQCGELPMARIFLEKAAQTELEETLKESVMIEIVEAAIAAGKSAGDTGLLEQAVQLASGIQNDKALRIYSAAEAAAHAGGLAKDNTLLDQALQFANQIDRPSDKALALYKISKATAEISLERAVQIAGQIDNAATKGEALFAIAQTAASNREPAIAKALLHQAVEVSSLIEDAERKARALLSVAHAAAGAGESARDHTLFEQAAQIANQLEDSGHKVRALSALGKAAAGAGELGRATDYFSQAAQIASHLDDWALSEVTVAAARAGGSSGDEALFLFQQAADVAYLIAAPGARASALSGVAEVAASVPQPSSLPARLSLAKALLDEAAQIAEQTGDPLWNAGALSEVAKAMGRVGASAGDKGLLEKAAQIASGIEHPGERARALSAVAEEAAKANFRSLASNTLEVLRASQSRDETALEQAVTAAAMIGRFDLARQLIWRIRDPDRRVDAMSRTLLWSARNSSSLAANRFEALLK